MIAYIYIIGFLLALTLSILVVYYERSNYYLKEDYDKMTIAVLSLMSWVSVILLVTYRWDNIKWSFNDIVTKLKNDM
jgi:hypothetical protein